MDFVKNFKSMTALQFCSLQIFEVVYVAALAFLPFIVASQKIVYAILFIFAIAVIVAIFKRRALRVVNPAGKTVLITSCGSGLGNACARRLVSRGFTVIAGCHDIDSEGACALKETDAENLHIVKLDITNETDIQQVMLQMNNLCHDKGLWALVNNAGVSDSENVEFLSLDTYKKKMNANLTEALRITKVFLPLIKAAKGRVIMVTGSTGKVTVPGQSAVYSSNSGLEVLSDSLRLELQPFGVKVITIKPKNLAGARRMLTTSGLLHLTRSSTSRRNNMVDAMENAVIRKAPKSEIVVDGGN